MPGYKSIVKIRLMVIKQKSQKTIKDYVSEIDKHLAEFDRSHSLSASQQAEIKKYQRVYERRDHPTPLAKKPSLWDF